MASTDPMKRGRLLYQMQCAACHGAEGRGDGPSAAELNPPPRDFNAGAWKHGMLPDVVRKVIREGVPGTAMPGSPSLSEGDLEALAAYVLAMTPTAGHLSAAQKQALRAAGFTPIDPPVQAPDLGLRDPQGRRHQLSQARGKVVLVSFWGTTCAPCLAELPHLGRLAEEGGARGLAVFAVCTDDGDADHVGAVAKLRAPRLPVFLPVDDLALLRYAVQVLPAACLIDRAGRVVGKSQGAHHRAGAEVDELLHAFSDEPGM